MTDKELIIKAAKAAGITGVWHKEDNMFIRTQDVQVAAEMGKAA